MINYENKNKYEKQKQNVIFIRKMLKKRANTLTINNFRCIIIILVN